MGDLLPADVKFISAVNVSINESAVTRESFPRQKQVFSLGEAALNLVGFKYIIIIFIVWVCIILLKKYGWDRWKNNKK